MVVINIISWVLILMGLSCATAIKNECPTVAEEPESICRARQNCRQKKTNYGVGLGLSTQTLENLGLQHERSLATKIYLDCVSKDLSRQRAANQIMRDEKKTID